MRAWKVRTLLVEGLALWALQLHLTSGDPKRSFVGCETFKKWFERSHTPPPVNVRGQGGDLSPELLTPSPPHEPGSLDFQPISEGVCVFFSEDGRTVCLLQISLWVIGLSPFFFHPALSSTAGGSPPPCFGLSLGARQGSSPPHLLLLTTLSLIILRGCLGKRQRSADNHPPTLGGVEAGER